ncbi:hypothetical protein L8106_07229 [Lyngbya sp. PCC 8106]|nr:hypothetical protein L8106_07229 [Lyngbya sp. PCC 8106]
MDSLNQESPPFTAWECQISVFKPTESAINTSKLIIPTPAQFFEVNLS